MLKKYRYHYGLVNMLSKKHCYDGRTAAFKAGSLDIMTRRDYAERLTAKFNQEIQSTHFGDAHYYNNPPRCRSVYCLVDLPVTVRVQHVMATNIVMEKITDTKQLPKNAQNKKQLISDGAFTISATDLEDIHNEIRRRTYLDYFEEPADDELDEDSGEYSDCESNC